jgi:spermidine synthase
MLGLGVGSLVGGEVSKKPSRPTLLLFSLVELGIGVFGVLSLPLFHAIGSLTLGLSPLPTFVLTFFLVLAPTTLMGSTLPLLVAHGVRASGNVGRSVGVLYFVNTLGSGLAAIAAVFLLMGALGQAKTVYLAAAVNLTVSALAFVQHRKSIHAAPASAASSSS